MLAFKRSTISLQISSLLTRSFLSVAANKKRNDKKWQVASPVVNEKHEGCRKVMGITVTPKQVVWALLDTSLSEIVDCGSCPFFDETEQFSHSTILHSAFRAAKKMPASDLYVLEEGWSTGAKPTAVLTKIMTTFDAMLSALLSEGYDPEDPFHRVFHMTPKVVTKLFGLQAGNERMSSQYIIRKMIKSSSVLGSNFEHQTIEEAASEDEKAYWIYRLCWTDVERAKLIWGKDHVWRENVSNSILIATAFTDLCLKVNPAAQNIFFRRVPIVPSVLK